MIISQGAAFFRTVLKLTDEDETDLARLDFYLPIPINLRSCRKYQISQAVAQLSENKILFVLKTVRL